MGNTLEHLLEIEAEAAALVDESRKEADRRIRENDDKNRVSYDKQLKLESQNQQNSFEKEKEKIKCQYQNALNDFREEISRIRADEEGFSALLNQYLEQSEVKTCEGLGNVV